MSSIAMTGARKTRSASVASTPTLPTTDESTLLEELRANLQSPSQFINLYHQCNQLSTLRSSLIHNLCAILSNSMNVDPKILTFILDCFITNHDSLFGELTDLQFKQDVLPFIKDTLSTSEDNNEILSSILKLLIVLIDYRANLLTLTLTEWLSSVLHFVVTRLSSTSYSIYGDLLIDLLTKIVQHFTPLPKEIVDVLGRSPSSVISTTFLTQLKTWVKHIDDTRLALFAIHLWEPLAALLSRLLTRGHTKGNEMLAVIQDAFVVANYSIRAAAFSAWASFMSHIYRSDLNLNNDDTHQQQLHQRLLKLFLTPFLPDYTSKSKSASISKCRAWLVLVSAYPTHIEDVFLPFLAFTFGNHTSCKTVSTTTAWWPECRKIGVQCLHDILIDNTNGEYVIKTAGDQILSYLFDSIVDEVLEFSAEDDKFLWLTSWNAYLSHLTVIFTSNNSINEEQRVAINTCLLTRIEQLWIDSRIPTRFLLKLFDTFEQTSFPLAIETVLRDTSIRTRTLSASQNNPSQDKTLTFDQTSACRTTLSDQYLHMMLEHAIRFNDEDQTIEDTYLHVLSYLIDTLSKISDDNFCDQTSLLLLKCSFELPSQPLVIPPLFWHIWLRCSTHLISILNRTRSSEVNHQRQETTIELLLRPFSFGDSQRLDYSYTFLWTQLFKALCRFVSLDGKHIIHLYIELLRHGLVFEQAINDQHYQRFFGFLLTTIKCLLKCLNDADLSTIPKRSLPSLSSITLCYTQLATIVNSVLQRVLSNDENNTQWSLVCYCLFKSNKLSTNEQSKSIVLTYVRDLIVDLFNTCKTCSQLEITLTNLTQIQPFLMTYEQLINSTTTTTPTPLGSSPLSVNKQSPSDNVVLNKIIATIHSVFESSRGSSLLQLVYPLFILAFQHNKTAMRNKTRKCWNETFGRSTFIIYPNELRACLRDLKDREHLLLPCFLADHDSSNTVGSGMLPSSADESQLSQQVDIATPLLIPSICLPRAIPSSPARISSPCLPAIRATNIERTEPVFVPITNNINHDNQGDSPVVISKRMSSTSTALTEKQKEKLRARHAIPLLCDDNSSTQSMSYAMDTPTIESMMATYQLRNTSVGNKPPTTENNVSLLTQPTSDASTSVQSSQENNSTVESSSSSSPSPPSPSSSGTTAESASVSEQVLSTNQEDDIPEESSITKKLRRSRRPSTSARKSLTNNARKRRVLLSSDEIIATVPSVVVDPAPSPPSSPSSSAAAAALPSDAEIVKSRPIKSILKRLSPTKPRQDQIRRVAFHDQVKVLLFASPSRRDLIAQQPKKKSPNRDELKNTSSMLTRRSSAIHSNDLSINNKKRSSKLFIAPDNSTSQLSVNSNESESPQMKPPEPIFPALVNCDKPLDSLIHVVYGGVCPTNAINYFRSIKMNTVGDIARSTAAQIEVYPIPPPKLTNIQKALSLYQERLITSPSLSPIIGTNSESLTPVASTSEEPIAFSDGTFTKEASSLPTAATTINDPHNSLYDVDTLIDSLDYERLYLNDNKEAEEESAPASTSQLDFIRARRQMALANRDEQISPQKRRLSSTNDDEDVDNQEADGQISPKKQTIVHVNLGDRLQKAADLFKTNGQLAFDDDYIELVRQLFNNSALTHLEQLHLKSLFLDN